MTFIWWMIFERRAKEWLEGELCVLERETDWGDVFASFGILNLLGNYKISPEI